MWALLLSTLKTNIIIYTSTDVRKQLMCAFIHSIIHFFNRNSEIIGLAWLSPSRESESALRKLWERF